MRFVNLVVAVVALSGCVGSVEGSGDIVTRTHDLSAFEGVDVCCGFDVEVVKSAGSAVFVRGDDNIVDEIRVEVRGDMLFVAYDRGAPSFRPTQPVKVVVKTGDLHTLRASGGSIVDVPSLSGTRVAVALSGGSQAGIGRVDAKELDVSLSGGSTVDVSGESLRQHVESSGGSRYLAADLQSAELDLHASGGSVAKVWVTDDIHAELSGGSQLSYAGDPEVSTEASGGSLVRPM